MVMDSPFSKWTPTPQEPWDIVRVAHLHRRASFTPDWMTIQRSLRDGCETSIDRLLGLNKPEQNDYELAEKRESQFEQMAATIGDAAVGSNNADRLRAWWVFRMLMTPRPLVERMTLLWHNHFATSNNKVQDLSAMYEQNNLLRKHCLGRFSELLPAVVKHRAMLSWLDAAANRKEHPNENLARELMELFTLGQGHYSEADVVEAARCLTGWTIRSNRFEFIPELHDSGEKSVLGHKGRLDGDGLLVLLLKQDATAKRIAVRLCEMFFGEEVVDEKSLSELAAGLQKNELSVAWGVETVLRSHLFFSKANIRSRVAGPVELVIGTARTLEMQKDPPSTLLLGAELRKLGQDLFHPPNVFGWPEGREWIHTRSVLARHGFADAIVAGKLHQSAHSPLICEHLATQHGFSNKREQVLEFYGLLISNQSNAVMRYGDGADIKTTEHDQLCRVVLRILADPENQLS
ncbi:MAG TPA: DUF1800 domain-containing protein [Pirellula sp.]|nr:DUF1800 domain-containing protein [Pirellula sp.]